MSKGAKTRTHSRYDALPLEVRELIDKRLKDPSYTYLDISEEVANMGYMISKSSVGRLALSRNRQTKALEIRLAIAKQQAQVAADAAKDGSTADYAEGILSIVATEMANRILSASTEEFDHMDMEDVLKAVSRLTRDMTSLARFKYIKDKGTSDIYDEVSATVEQYFDDDPELREKIMQKVRAKLDEKTP